MFEDEDRFSESMPDLSARSLEVLVHQNTINEPNSDLGHLIYNK